MLKLFLAALPFVASLSWFSASDTHLGHDPVTPNGTIVTSYEKNVWAIEEMNTLATPSCRGNCAWPAALGGGPVLPPLGVTISGDLVDNGGNPGTVVNGCAQWSNFTALYGLTGTDGLLKYKCYEGRGNHDTPNTTNAMPHDCATVPSRAIVARNKLRAADPAFAIDGTSSLSGLHYSWTWSIDDTCRVHFVQLNLLPGHTCGTPANPTHEGTFPCTDGWVWPEDSMGFLQSDLAANDKPGTVMIAIHHYGFDGFSNSWYNSEQREELFNTLSKYKTLAVLVGHTHGAAVYAYNGTAEGAWEKGGEGGYVHIINAPATQKEDGQHNPLPSEFMVLEATMLGGGVGSLRVAQRVGSGWGTVMGQTNFTC